MKPWPWLLKEFREPEQFGNNMIKPVMQAKPAKNYQQENERGMKR